MEFGCTARNQIYSHFSSPGWNFLILGLLERSGPSESILEALSSTRATSMTSPNWPTMPRNETTTQSQFFIGSLLKFNRFSRFKLLCKAEINALHLMSITNAQGKREIPWHAPKNCEVTNKKIRNHSSLQPVISVFILSQLSESLSYREELYISGKLSSIPFQRCIVCGDRIPFHRVTELCTLVYSPRTRRNRSACIHVLRELAWGSGACIHVIRTQRLTTQCQ